MFDYGTKLNSIIYGQPTPKNYPLKNFNIPTVLYYGGHDLLVNTRDTNRLINEIKNSLIDHFYLPEYNHLDFVWGLDAAKMLYPSILHFLNRSNN